MVRFFLWAGIASGCLALAPLAKAQNNDELRRALNNFSHENMTCGAYYGLVSVCLQRDPKGDSVSTTYAEEMQIFNKRGIDTGKLAGLSDKALLARSQIEVEEMKSEVDNNCSNLAILLQKHAKTCKALMENGPAQLQAMIQAFR